MSSSSHEMLTLLGKDGEGGYCLNPGSNGVRAMTNLGQEDTTTCVGKVQHRVALCKGLEFLVDLVNDRCEAAARRKRKGGGGGGGCQVQDHAVAKSAPVVANAGGAVAFCNSHIGPRVQNPQHGSRQDGLEIDLGAGRFLMDEGYHLLDVANDAVHNSVHL